MAARAQKIRLPLETQRQLDFVSGSVTMFLCEYDAAASYYAEGQFPLQTCLCKILAEKYEIEK